MIIVLNEGVVGSLRRMFIARERIGFERTVNRKQIWFAAGSGRNSAVRSHGLLGNK